MNRRNSRSSIPGNFILIFLTIVCIVLLFINYATGFTGGPLMTVANYVFVPMQRGMDYVGNSISSSNEEAKTRSELLEENEQLRAQVDELTTRLTDIQLQQTELDELLTLYDLDSTYKEYKMTGAHVIARGMSNWFSTFTIDKGTSDGIKKDMNVLAGSGLVGIVTQAGQHYSTVRAVIDDTNNISAMILDTDDNCIVSGNLKMMTESSMIALSALEDKEDKVKSGDAVVTSNISDKYLPGLLIGYVNELEIDSSGLTKSGTMTPVVDFKHLRDVLVILETKETSD
ncbi:MAG: rod shape-determining protein MreC [Lachnospiraceae bacterium]|nr:rod shape-determining protein MreC [Lachnospiraceae bacterium]